jgi:hypothetical protein
MIQKEGVSPFFMLYYKVIDQFSSLRILTQKKFLLFADLRNSLSPVICSMIHVPSELIRFAKRFFAFLLIGCTVRTRSIGLLVEDLQILHHLGR